MRKRIDEAIWYSRQATLVGAAMLLAQAIFGRPVGPVTLIAMLLLVVGCMVFLAALALSGLDLDRLVPSMARAFEPAYQLPPAAESGPTPADAILEPAAETESIPAFAASPPMTREEVPLENPWVAPETPAKPGRVVAVDVVEGSAMTGRLCARCGTPLEIGQLAASCPQCGGSHHAVCWIENHFHCSTPACAGAGSLEAPEAS